MPHVDLKLRQGRRPLSEKDLRAWCAVLCAELNSLRQALQLPPLRRQDLEAAVRAATRGAPPQPETE